MRRFVPFLGLACLAAAVALVVNSKSSPARLTQPRDSQPEPSEAASSTVRLERVPTTSRQMLVLAPRFHAQFSVN